MFEVVEVTLKQFKLYINENETKYCEIRAKEKPPEGKII